MVTFYEILHFSSFFGAFWYTFKCPELKLETRKKAITSIHNNDSEYYKKQNVENECICLIGKNTS